jgi:DNA-binding PucR family transcriptional regulator
VGVGSAVEIRGLLAARVRARALDLEAGVATRAYAIADPHAVGDPSYPQRLHAALRAGTEYALAGLESGERLAPELPEAILAQARLDARVRVPLDTVLRRHFAAGALFDDLLAEEAERAEVPAEALRRLRREGSARFDRLLAAVGAEYGREAAARPRGSAERRRERVKRLLAGELVVDEVELNYDLDGWHLAVMAQGEGGEAVLRELARRTERRLLAVQREEEPTWAGWLGGGRPLASAAAMRSLAEFDRGSVAIALGEPAAGLTGWRFSHLQAKAALPLATGGRGAVRFAEVALAAALRRDELLATSLRRLYIEPLEASRDGGAAARETLAAWFRCERNITATAAALGVDRRTVRNRLRAVEAALGRPLPEVALDLELALRLDP